MARYSNMELTIRGKNIFENATSIRGMVECLIDMKKRLEELPQDAKVINSDDDYVFIGVNAIDKDDYKYFKSKGFRKI
jgi:hypothetical protein